MVYKEKRIFLIVVLILMLSLTLQGWTEELYIGSDNESIMSELIQLDEALFNELLIGEYNKNKEKIASQLVGGDLRELELGELRFDISSGIMYWVLGFKYKGKVKGISISTDGTGEIKCRLLVNNDCTEYGVYIEEVTDLSLRKALDIIDVSDIVKALLNNTMVNKNYWFDGKQYDDYMVFNSDNLTQIMNGLLVNNENFKKKLKPIEYRLPGGMLNIGFENIQLCNFDVKKGRMVVESTLDGEIKLFSGDSFSFKEWGELYIDLDLFVHKTSKSWWIKLNDLRIDIKKTDPDISYALNEMIYKELGRSLVLCELGEKIKIIPASGKTEDTRTPFPTRTPSPASPLPESQRPYSVPTPLKAYEPVPGWDRSLDPVVIKGEDVPSLTGILPEELVAWRYTGKWEQIPIQVDERAEMSLLKIYNVSPKLEALYRLAGRKDVHELCYTDPDTFASSDPDESFDSDDEAVFMSKDLGQKAVCGFEPEGVIKGTGVEIKVVDPINGSEIGYVYLFRQKGDLEQSAGKRYVDYNFKLLSGDYKTTYKTGDGPNPEDSTISTAYYGHHFSDRWINDGLWIFTNGRSSLDLLDRHKILTKPGGTNRTEDTFCEGKDEFPGEGCFVANINGPVRAIRSYIGSNSGFLTQREHLFYERRQDINTFLRVHEMSEGFMDFFDYSPDSKGMVYYNDLNTSGVTVDGEPDDVLAGQIKWELLEGDQGSIVHVHNIVTDVPDFSYSSYYLDDSTPDVVQATGDEYAYGSSGIWVRQTVPNTDPSVEGANLFKAHRTIYYGSKGATVTDAQNLEHQANMPLKYSVKQWKPLVKGDLNSDGAVNSIDYVLIKRYVLGVIDVEDILSSGDLNGDGRINSTDCSLMKRFLLKLIDSFPV